MNKLNLNSPEVQAAIKEHSLTPGKNGDVAVKPGSRKKTPQVEEPAIPSEIKKKKFSIELTTAQEFRLLRESSVRNIDAIAYLQEIIDEKLGKGVGASFISAPRLNGQSTKKVTGPTNAFGREV